MSSKVSSVHALNMRSLLKEEEVLTFAFDDFNKSLSNIIVQAKDLYVYQIDINNHQVIKKIINGRHSLNMSSIFYNVTTYSKEKQRKQSSHLLEFIENQEH